MIINIRVVQQHLGGNAADVQAGAAQVWIFLHHDGLQSQLTGANGRHVSARPAPDDRYVVLSHTALLPGPNRGATSRCRHAHHSCKGIQATAEPRGWKCR